MTTEQRLERLEREIRWMRRIGAVGVAVVAAVFLIGQGKTLGTVEAREFVLRGEEGERLGSLSAYKKFWGLNLFDGVGNTVISLGVVKSKGGTYGEMDMCYSGGYIPVRADHTGRQSVPHVAAICLSTVGDDPSIELTGEELIVGRPILTTRATTRMVIGVTRLKTPTGGTRKTPPSSIVLFDKEGKVIWKAPKE